MRKIASCRSRGGRMCRSILFGLIVVTVGGATRADDYLDGEAAYSKKNYASAAFYWQRAASKGSAEANLRLGLLADVGLGMPRDPAAAFHYYLSAAQAGLPEAAFNVGVMLDSGVGVARDGVGAIVWYARAALGGNSRAALNLGLLYRDGNGIPANTQLAAYWLGTVAPTLPAAQDSLRRLEVETHGQIGIPVPLSAELLMLNGQHIANLVWSSGPGTPSSLYAVQIISTSPSNWADRAVTYQETAASAVQIAVPDGSFLWRVSQIDPVTHRYEASDWQEQTDNTLATDPKGIVSIVYSENDHRATTRARHLADTLTQSGLAVRMAHTVKPITASEIRYRYLNDAGLARDVAIFLPGYTAGNVALSDDVGTGPGEVVVYLSFDPSNNDYSIR